MPETSYKIVQLKDMTFGVEVLKPQRGAPYTVDTFANRADAEKWVADQMHPQSGFNEEALERVERNLPRNYRDKD